MVSVVQLLGLICFTLLSVAFFSLFERKLMGMIQNRMGPNKVIGKGVTQPFADALKLLSKSEQPTHSSFEFMYFISPIFFFSISLIFWIAVPVNWIIVQMTMSIFLILTLFSSSVYGLIMSGWFSNSKYSTIGMVRAFTQSISYEIGLTSLILFVSLMFSSSSILSISLIQLSMNLIFPFLWVFVAMILVVVGELNRSPFDLSEGESELVSGYSVEYGGLSYTMLFLSENLSLLFCSILISELLFSSALSGLVFFFVWLRATLPRLRFDKMIELFWVVFLPIVFSLIMVNLITLGFPLNMKSMINFELSRQKWEGMESLFPFILQWMPWSNSIFHFSSS